MVETKSQNFGGLLSTFVEVTEEKLKLVEGAFLLSPLPLPPTHPE